MKRCLYCYQLLNEKEVDFHNSCSKKIFEQSIPPVLPYTENQMEELATKVIQSQMTVTGVQPKLSLGLVSGDVKTDPNRFTIVGLWGSYILKPPTPHYPQLPEIEDLTMHLASLAKINIVPHSLIRLKSGNLAYITKRIDRTKTGKIHIEDLCQLTEKLTEDKYYGSYEQIAKTILKYSANPGLDIVYFFEQVLFSFLIGNSDMHLKNISLINQPGIGYVLSPAYDIVATVIVNPYDKEELALTLNGKKRKIKRIDFTTAFNNFHLEVKQQENIFRKMEKARNMWMDFIDISFLSEDFKEVFKDLINERFTRLEIKK